MGTLIRNGTVCLEDRLEVCDLLLERDKIADIGKWRKMDAVDSIVDASGMVVLPGMIDLHTHLDDRIGRYRLADTFGSGSRAAVLNGITTIGSFITQKGSGSLSAVIDEAFPRAEGSSLCDYFWHITPVRSDGQTMDELEEWIRKGFSTIKLYTTYREGGLYASYDRIDALFRRFGETGARFLIHCEDDDSLARVKWDRGRTQTAGFHAVLRPPEAEIEAIRRVLGIARERKTRVHVVHVSTAAGVDLIRSAGIGTSITCETAPHYLFLDRGWLEKENGHRWICTPPLREKNESGQLRRRVDEGLVDALATDHCAFSRKDKDDWQGDARRAASGVGGIGALVPLACRFFQGRPSGPWSELSRRLAANPARIAGLYPRKGVIRKGADADLAIVRESGPPRAIRSSMADVHETYPGFTTNLSFRSVFLRGEPVVENDRLVRPDHPRGVWLCRK